MKYLIRDADQVHAIVVEGEAVPNNFGYDLFVHHWHTSDDVWFMLSDASTGSLIYGPASSKEFAIIGGLRRLVQHRDSIADAIERFTDDYGPLSDAYVLTLEQYKARGRKDLQEAAR